MQIAHIFVLYIVVTVFHFHNGTFTTHITSELLHSALSSAVWSVYRSGDQSNPFSFWRHCNRKTSVRHAAWTRLRARHDVLHLLCRCLFLLQCLFGFVLLVVLRFHSNARFKWEVRQWCSSYHIICLTSLSKLKRIYVCNLHENASQISGTD